MSTSFRSYTSAGNAWLVAGGSLAAMAVLVLLLWNPGGRHGSTPRELVLYCAAGMIQPVTDICRDYERTYGVTVQVEPDGSGKLLSKMRVVPDRGDLFLAADATYIELARREDLVAEAIPVATIHPVIATQPGNPRRIAGIQDLLRDEVKVTLANPELAAIGRTARQALKPTGEWEALERQVRQFQAKVSLVGTVNEVAQAVKIGAADAGIVWDATARQYELPVVEVPALQKATEHITLGVLRRSRVPRQALHFARYLTARDRGLVHFRNHSFAPVPDADTWAETPAVDLFSGAMLRPVVDEVVRAFQEREGARINCVYNGCGVLVTQMKGGLHPAAYFACDVSFVDQVRPLFLEPVALTANDIVLLVHKGNPHRLARLADLTHPGLRVGVGHPEQSALGALTRRLLEKQGLAEALRASGNVKVESATGDYLVNQLVVGALDVALVYRSNARSNPDTLDRHADLVEVDAPDRQAVQPFAIGKESEHQYLMRRLLEALATPEARQRFEALGFRWVARSESP